jgi:hypothetical protein
MAIRKFSLASIKSGSKSSKFWDQTTTIFSGGNQSQTDLYTLANLMTGAEATAPTSGGTLTINSVSLGSYDYCVRNGETISSFTASDYFTSTEDTRAAFVVFNGNTTINNGITFKPSVRKLFTVIYVKGNLTLNGEISMSQRGANHSGTGNSGGSTTKGNILIYSGTHGGVSNPQIPASGGAGGSDAVGTAGTSGGTGGGGSGNNGEGVGTYGRAGSAGTSFTGGSGSSGECCNSVVTAPVDNGGKGGIAGQSGADGVGGGAGNPGGGGWSGSYTGYAGSDGTGGVLVIFVTGTLSGTGSITAAGATGGNAAGNGSGAYARCGGGSGGGSVTVLYGTDSSSITPTASGGAGGDDTASSSTYGNGFAGGAGTARKLAI